MAGESEKQKNPRPKDEDARKEVMFKSQDAAAIVTDNWSNFCFIYDEFYGRRIVNYIDTIKVLLVLVDLRIIKPL